MVCICALHVMCTLPPRPLTQNSRWVFLVLEIVFCTLRLENGLGGFSWASGLVGLRISSYLVFFTFYFHWLHFFLLPACRCWWVLLGCCWAAAGDCWGLLVVGAGGCWGAAGGCCWAAAGLLLGTAGSWWLLLVAAGGCWGIYIY